ncbi:TRAP transporter permease [Pseudomonas saliphila]|uniref:TRAP transporter permease n=1 Tax=Pseudomonas saliphila TaxID=2586906 RepID=UPI0012386696|nr:TRAP transporter permease [Pseudomonas saliphila]
MTNKKMLGLAIIAISLLFTGFQVFTATNGLMTALLQRSIHLSFVLTLVFLFFPAIKDSKRTLFIDVPLVLAAATSGAYLYITFDDLIYRIGDPTTLDLIIGATTLVVLLEATRRTVGWVMTLLAVFSLLYSYFGQYLPEPFGHSGRDLERIVTQMFFSTEGIYGVPLGVAATYVFLFILFGTFMEKSGVGAIFINLANALAGKYQGGPAKVGIISTATVGMVSGSPVSDAATTGAFTIPLMKRVGYKPKTAAAIEAVGASGASLMPPIMGAGAFVMADMTGVPYSSIITHALIPALLFYAALMFVVGNEARKGNMKSLPPEEIPGKRDALMKSLRLLIPLGVLVFSLAVLRVSPLRAALFATLIILVTTVAYNIFRPELKVPMRNLFDALIETPRKVLVVSVACATAGIIIGMLGMTGLGLKLSDILMNASQGYLVVALLFAMVISIVLGMGLPPTAAYIVMAVTAAPFLIQMGVPLIVAHFFVFMYCCYAPITPPVALAAYTTAGIAGCDPFEAGIESFRISLTGFVLPIMIVFNPSLLGIGAWHEILMTCVFAACAVWMMAIALVGYLHKPVNALWRLLLAAAALGCLMPLLWTNVAALGVLALFLVTNTSLFRTRATTASFS